MAALARLAPRTRQRLLPVIALVIQLKHDSFGHITYPGRLASRLSIIPQNVLVGWVGEAGALGVVAVSGVGGPRMRGLRIHLLSILIHFVGVTVSCHFPAALPPNTPLSRRYPCWRHPDFLG